MNHNSINIGERSYCGDYGMINSAGELHAEKSTIKRLNSAGECTFTECKLIKVRSAGQVNMISSSCEDFYNIGDANFSGECSGKTIAICGGATADLLECELLVYRKIDRTKIQTSKIGLNGYFKSEVFECCEPIYINFEYDFHTIISAASITSAKEIACERLIALDALSVPSLNAADILLPALCGMKLESVTGERIRVLRHIDVVRELRGIPNDGMLPKKVDASGTIAHITSVEGDDITLENTYCDNVCGTNIKIGDMCVVNRVECSGELEISPKAAVNEIVRG